MLDGSTLSRDLEVGAHGAAYVVDDVEKGLYSGELLGEDAPDVCKQIYLSIGAS